MFNGSTGYLTVPNNAVFDFGAGDFTIEYWEYRTTNAQFKPVISRNVGGYPAFLVGWSEAGSILFLSSSNGTSWNVSSGASMGSIILNSWTHYAVTRSGNTFRTFQNGALISTFTSANAFPAGTGPLLVGAYNTPNFFYQGHLDDIRITKGIARYTAAFTPPENPFPDMASGLLTKYVGQIGGLNDTDVDYGIEKLSDTSLKIRKMSATGNPVGGGGLGSTVNRVYVNIQDFGATAASQVPAGGTTGQVLTKVNNTDYNVVWATPSAGGSVAWADITGKPSTFPPDTHLHGISDVTGLQGALDAKAPLASPTFTGTVSGITKSMVGLGNVDNTSDASKPISTATQTALDGKAATSHTHAIADVTGLQSALDGKQAAGSYAAATHTHAISDVTGLQTALDGKQKTITSGTAAPSGGVDGDFYFQYT